MDLPGIPLCAVSTLYKLSSDFICRPAQAADPYLSRAIELKALEEDKYVEAISVGFSVLRTSQAEARWFGDQV